MYHRSNFFFYREKEICYFGIHGYLDNIESDFSKIYTITKRHFMGNVGIEYEYYLPELKTGLYNLMIGIKK